MESSDISGSCEEEETRFVFAVAKNDFNALIQEKVVADGKMQIIRTVSCKNWTEQTQKKVNG